jgi:hypothetical protein
MGLVQYGPEGVIGTIDKGGEVVLDAGTLLMTGNIVKQTPTVAHCCCAVMRLSIWRETKGNVENTF